jgi:apolipoprotein N-acyltransferase
MPALPYILAALSGFLLTLAFAPFEFADAGWGAMVPLLVACGYAKPRQVWRMGWLAGVVFWLVTAFWLTRVTWFGWFLLALYCALFFIPVALFAAAWLRRRGSGSFGGNFVFMLLVSAIWVGAEYVRSIWHTGFPWNPLGASQYANLAFIQHATWGGVYGISAMMMFTNAAIAVTILRYLQGHARLGRKPHPELMAAMAVVVIAFVTGNRMVREEASGGHDELRVALIQPSIPQDEKWDEEKVEMIYRRLRELTTMAVQVTQPDLVVWPETALPYDVRHSEACYRLVQELAGLGAPILAGSMDSIYLADRKPVYYNSSFLFDTNGVIVEGYDKRHLVLFGEYVPAHEHIRFITAMTPIAESFSSGSTSTVFRALGDAYPFASLICFEDTMAYLARDAVRNGARLLINQTNDAWFDPLWGSWQHMALSVFRAVENRVPLVRAANTGVSCAIDDRGRINERLVDAEGRHDGPGFQLALVRVPSAAGPATFYARYGDVFAWLMLVAGLPAWVWAWRFNRVSRLEGSALSEP